METKHNLPRITELQNNTKEINIILADVIEAMKEKGYNPINQLVGYVLTGEPTYITGHKEARIKIQKIDRDVLLEVMVESYIKKLTNE